jgi:hypothetical protein
MKATKWGTVHANGAASYRASDVAECSERYPSLFHERTLPGYNALRRTFTAAASASAQVCAARDFASARGREVI